ncbi:MULTISPECIES: MarC family protein [unclassified Herbaspirillum]|uniref:MarC family protein n=1 Tax=unclassified Herbaspirillum TaxID=2624150 RepID=UPI00114E74BE|nr:MULTISPECIES: MarC family protein [unclassified Herbaspirillum]MBB5390157.1 multiple antibiotic resistance protein [Herbaspirillum sp. SJZ102]TQK09344.1 multiple antibiotic resistance protein [Herbaspirillum sp. SJZ130]TQK13969.1 multiple antibiotic resistance protein [Herbaspirillum sp. SJZ106]TWC69694.1 multiple antibiotic resistance protein [Herbaspirillum sp. SJZ099]
MLILFLKAAILIPITLLPILNPLGIAPVFANLLGNVSRKTEKKIARQVAINCWFMLVGAIFIGSHVLTFFGISLPIVRVGGGLLVAASGWKLLSNNSQDSAIPNQVAKSYDEDLPDEEIKARSFYPMSFPLTVGPGTIAASITLGANTPTRLLDWVISVGSAAFGAALTALAVFLCYNYAQKLVQLMGRLGTMVVLRLSAFILLCIGIQIFWSGMAALLAEAGISGAAP